MMGYGEYDYSILKNYPKELDDIGLTPIHVPKQDGYKEHYALLDNDKSEVFCTNSLSSLVNEADERIQKNKNK